MKETKQKSSLLYLVKVHVIDHALRKFDGNRIKASEYIGISTRGMRYMIKGNDFLNAKYDFRKNRERELVIKDLLVMARSKITVKDSLYYKCLSEDEKEFVDKMIEDFDEGSIA